MSKLLHCDCDLYCDVDYKNEMNKSFAKIPTVKGIPIVV